MTSSPPPTLLLALWNRLSCPPDWPQTPCIAKEEPWTPTALSLSLHPPPEFWDDRREPPHQVYMILGVKSRAPCMPGKHCADGAAFSALDYTLWRPGVLCLLFHMCVWYKRVGTWTGQKWMQRYLLLSLLHLGFGDIVFRSTWRLHASARLQPGSP